MAISQSSGEEPQWIEKESTIILAAPRHVVEKTYSNRQACLNSLKVNVDITRGNDPNHNILEDLPKQVLYDFRLGDATATLTYNPMKKAVTLPENSVYPPAFRQICLWAVRMYKTKSGQQLEPFKIKIPNDDLILAFDIWWTLNFFGLGKGKFDIGKHMSRVMEARPLELAEFKYFFENLDGSHPLIAAMLNQHIKHELRDSPRGDFENIKAYLDAQDNAVKHRMVHIRARHDPDFKAHWDEEKNIAFEKRAAMKARSIRRGKNLERIQKHADWVRRQEEREEEKEKLLLSAKDGQIALSEREVKNLFPLAEKE
jgi:hypothetical protein